MSYGSMLLWANAVFFVVYGLLFVVMPETLAAMITGAAPASGSPMIDTRATYGGMTIAVGVVFAMCARSAAERLGLLAVATVMFCMAFGRVVGIAVDGAANAMMFVYLGAEVIVLLLALAASRTPVST